MGPKLLFVNSSLTDGGSEKAMSLVAQALAARGYDVTMVLLRDKERTYDLGRDVRVIQLGSSARGKASKIFSRVLELRRSIKEGAYDYVICYMWDLNITTLVASYGLPSRVVVSERAFPGATTRTRFWRLIERLTYSRAHRIVYQTPDAQAFCAPGLRDKSVVVPNMIEAADQTRALETREKRVVAVGRLDEQKNYPLLLHSFAEFLLTNPEWKLEIYGRGALGTELEALAERLGIRRSVTFVGYVSDLAVRINTAGMFVMSSDFEGISNAMAEAMALGLPVICTDCPVGGAAMLIRDRISGLLVPVGDQGALRDAMCEVAADAALAQQVSQGARSSVASFSPDRMALVWEQEVLC